ncbi:MAG: hypothetical protein UX06_C0040G0004 [Candidatus Giovannonibacteria bacterium GW2011_GWA2_45_21]|uniref:Uncharacterized protein n=1 Tax=Candidatus Giovannonibacteria bacterium GW2011_GWA2_45_21 TaxID=1618649 RepID=A0A0G1M5M4_9BACT|nr:MAG: hypothetical protein UX06_C0040G0004 [Candidatus Giovannonibacteria bacterium GW2011_GWA2_45_21]
MTNKTTILIFLLVSSGFLFNPLISLSQPKAEILPPEESDAGQGIKGPPIIISIEEPLAPEESIAAEEVSVAKPLLIQRIKNIESKVKTLELWNVAIVALLIPALLFNLYLFITLRKFKKSA